MGFDTVEHAKQVQAIFYPENIHIKGIDMKQSRIQIDDAVFQLISAAGAFCRTYRRRDARMAFAVSVMQLCRKMFCVFQSCLIWLM